MAVAEAGAGGRWMGKSMHTAIRATLTARLSCWQSFPRGLSYDEQVRPWWRTPIQFIARIGLASLIAPYPSTTLPIKLIAVKLLLT